MDTRSTKCAGPEGAEVRLAALSPILLDSGQYEAARARLIRGIVGTDRRLFPDLEEHFRALFLHAASSSRGLDGTAPAGAPAPSGEAPRPTRAEEEFLGRALDLSREALRLEIRRSPHPPREASLLRRRVSAWDPLFLDALRGLRDRRPGTPAVRLLEEKVRRVSARLEDARRVRNLLVARNLHCVPVIATRYRNLGVPYADLTQEGSASLCRAADKFDWRRAVRFSTYAQWWIQQAVLKCVYSQGRVIRLPVYMGQKIRKLRGMTVAAYGETGRSLSAEELSASLDEPLGRVRRALRSAAPIFSLDGESRDRERGVLRDLVADPRRETASENGPSPGLRGRLDAALEALSPRERRIVRLRFGYPHGGEKTLEEVSTLFGVSRERIRQIQVRALRKLRSEAGRNRLAAYFG